MRVLEDLGTLHFVYDTVRNCRRLPPDIPLLGFAGAPFTLASYVIEGGGSRNYVRTKTLMHTDAGAWRTLMERLVESLQRYLIAQIEAGCQAVQVFDSWAGCLSPADYREFVQPYTQRLIRAVAPHAPVINFVTGNPALLSPQSEAGGQVIGVDWRADLGEVRRLLGPQRAVQGNLDPVTLFADAPNSVAAPLRFSKQAAAPAISSTSGTESSPKLRRTMSKPSCSWLAKSRRAAEATATRLQLNPENLLLQNSSLQEQHGNSRLLGLLRRPDFRFRRFSRRSRSRFGWKRAGRGRDQHLGSGRRNNDVDIERDMNSILTFTLPVVLDRDLIVRGIDVHVFAGPGRQVLQKRHVRRLIGIDRVVCRNLLRRTNVKNRWGN